MDEEKIQEKSRAIGLAGALAHASQPWSQTYKKLTSRGEFLFAQGQRRHQMGQQVTKGSLLAQAWGDVNLLHTAGFRNKNTIKKGLKNSPLSRNFVEVERKRQRTK